MHAETTRALATVQEPSSSPRHQLCQKGGREVVLISLEGFFAWGKSFTLLCASLIRAQPLHLPKHSMTPFLLRAEMQDSERGAGTYTWCWLNVIYANFQGVDEPVVVRIRDAVLIFNVL
jgi:hypothetical protein